MKLLAGLGALFLYGSLGVASGVGDIQQEPPPPMSLTTMGAAPTGVVPEGGAAVQAAGSTGRRPVMLQEMSDEEKERRREECATLYEHCYDWCGKAHKRGSAALRRCNQECSDKNTECMKKIPN
ncbi:hypothetical protein [Polyangium mundeleinium]|uniref:Uncharacterized protein n=1 Tax=Polyangium mundeleinium TaxID=2995306 RepID=A0ABT5EHF3_9BACT|nr:hypothetical protein [Polyangium mundeleinium]MDC0741248.1 hypothetical protein [Polyangium mundeleinium]